MKEEKLIGNLTIEFFNKFNWVEVNIDVERTLCPCCNEKMMIYPISQLDRFVGFCFKCKKHFSQNVIGEK